MFICLFDGVQCHIPQYFGYIVTVSFIAGADPGGGAPGAPPPSKKKKKRKKKKGLRDWTDNRLMLNT